MNSVPHIITMAGDEAYLNVNKAMDHLGVIEHHARQAEDEELKKKSDDILQELKKAMEWINAIRML